MRKIAVFILCLASLASCKKEKIQKGEEKTYSNEWDTPAKKSILVAKEDNPYAKDMAPGAAAYFLVRIPIGDDNQISCNYVYTNSDNGSPYSSSRLIYYDPDSDSFLLQFGSKVSGNVNEFRAKVNNEIAKKGYAIITHFVDGGPDYRNFTLYETDDTYTW